MDVHMNIGKGDAPQSRGFRAWGHNHWRYLHDRRRWCGV